MGRHQILQNIPLDPGPPRKCLSPSLRSLWLAQLAAYRILSALPHRDRAPTRMSILF